VAGSFLFIAASLQQIGIQYTTAGKAGFLTGLYVVLVPIVGMLWGRSTGLPTWVGAILAVIGIYTLSAPDAGKSQQRGHFRSHKCSFLDISCIGDRQIG